jgi:hypothetical protein
LEQRTAKADKRPELRPRPLRCHCCLPPPLARRRLPPPPPPARRPLEPRLPPASPRRDAARRQLLDLLDSIRGRKALVLEAGFAAPLGLIADALTLKEHGVEV